MSTIMTMLFIKVQERSKKIYALSVLFREARYLEERDKIWQQRVAPKRVWLQGFNWNRTYSSPQSKK